MVSTACACHAHTSVVRIGGRLRRRRGSGGTGRKTGNGHRAGQGSRAHDGHADARRRKAAGGRDRAGRAQDRAADADAWRRNRRPVWIDTRHYRTGRRHAAGAARGADGRARRSRAARRCSDSSRSSRRSGTRRSTRNRRRRPPRRGARRRRSEVQRAEQLVKDGAGSRRALEEAQAELAVAEAELKAARDRVALASAQRHVAGRRRSSTRRDSAVVQAVHVREGQTVAAGAPLIDLVRLATVWVRVPVYAGESASIDASAPAQVLTLGEAPDADGVLARPIPRRRPPTPTTAGIDLYYAMANPNQRFRPGERVAVRLTRRESRDRARRAEGRTAPRCVRRHLGLRGARAAGLFAPARRRHRRQRPARRAVAGTRAKARAS